MFAGVLGATKTTRIASRTCAASAGSCCSSPCRCCGAAAAARSSGAAAAWKRAPGRPATARFSLLAQLNVAGAACVPRGSACCVAAIGLAAQCESRCPAQCDELTTAQAVRWLDTGCTTQENACGRRNQHTRRRQTRAPAPGACVASTAASLVQQRLRTAPRRPCCKLDRPRPCNGWFDAQHLLQRAAAANRQLTRACSC